MERLIFTVEHESPIPSLSKREGTGASFFVKNTSIEAEVSSWNKDCIRLSLFPRKASRKRVDYGIVSEASYKPVPIELSEQDAAFSIKSGDVTLLLENNPLRFSLYRGKRLCLQPATDSHFTRRFRFPPFHFKDDNWCFSFDIPFETSVFGLGEQHHGINHRGQFVESYNRDALGVNSEQTYKNIPFLWSLDGWGMLIHTSAPVHHSIAYPKISNRTYIAEVEDQVLDLFFFTASSPAKLIDIYTTLTGKTKKVPDWSLGFWTSKAYYKDQDELMDVARTMRARNLPCNVITLDGRAWQHTETRFAFEWDSRYPNPQETVANLKELGYELCVWMYPLLSVKNPLFSVFEKRGWLLKDSKGKAYLYEWDMSPFGKVLTPLPLSGIYDFTNKAFLVWWKKEVTKLARLGIRAIKTDFAEQVPDDCRASNGAGGRSLHNVYSLLYNKATYEALLEYHGAGNALVWGRSGWTSSQQYPIQWAGDSQSDWGGMAASIMGNINYGLSGGAYYTYDIGGFYGERPSDEQYIRWTQCACFSSHCRFHGIGDREPWNFSRKTENIVRTWMEFRHRLLPYLKKTCKQAVSKGLPVVRAMVLAYPQHGHLHSYEFQYMFGDDVFVAPVIHPGGKVTYFLPPGKWKNIFTRKVLEGNQEISETVPLEHSVAYIKEDSTFSILWQ